MPKPVFTSLLVALALFISFLVVQQHQPAQAAVVALSLSVDPGIAAGVQTDPSHVSSNVNVALAGRTVTVSVTDDTAAAPVVTVKNDTTGTSATVVVTGGSAGVPWTGTFVVIDSTELGATGLTEVEAEDGDIIQVTSGFLIVQITVDSDPPNMNENVMVPADGAISGDGLTPVSGRVDDGGAGVAEEDISVWTGPSGGTLFQVPASLISFTETAAEDGFTFSTFINIPTDGTQDLQFR